MSKCLLIRLYLEIFYHLFQKQSNNQAISQSKTCKFSMNVPIIIGMNERMNELRDFNLVIFR